MDKTLFKAYVRELVKEMIQEEVERVLPKVLGDAVQEIKSLQESTPMVKSKPKLDRAKLAEMMGLERIGDTIVATTNNIHTPPPPGMSVEDPTMQAINKDYSALMKKMGLSK